MSKKILINGVIEVQDCVTEDEFLDKFLRFVELNGWQYFGHTTEDETGESTGKVLKSILELPNNQNGI